MKPQKPRLQGTFFLLYPKWGPGANGASSEQTTKKYLKPVGSYEKTAWPKGRCLWAFPPPKKNNLKSMSPHFSPLRFLKLDMTEFAEAKLPQVCAEPSLPLSFPHGSRALIQEMSRGTSGKFKILVELCHMWGQDPLEHTLEDPEPQQFYEGIPWNLISFRGFWGGLQVMGFSFKNHSPTLLVDLK